MIELVVKLVLAAGLIVAAVIGFKRMATQGMANRGGPSLKVVGRMGLTRASLVAVIDVDGRQFLVGAADQGVQLLADLGVSPDAPPAVDEDQLVLDLDAAPELDGLRADDLVLTSDVAHGMGSTTTHGPRIGPLDRLREMTVRSHLREPIRALQRPRG